jgi:hypothetical protein
MPRGSHRRGFDEPDVDRPHNNIDQLVTAAKSATVDLIGLLAAHGLDFPTLALMLDPGWPENVKRALVAWVIKIDDVAKALAAEAGIPAGAALSEKDRQTLTVRAFNMVMD